MGCNKRLLSEPLHEAPAKDLPSSISLPSGTGTNFEVVAVAVVWIDLATAANRITCEFSSNPVSNGFTQTNITAEPSPRKKLLKISVSLECLYGTNVFLLSCWFKRTISMHLPRLIKPVLMWLASRKRSPVFCVCLARSEPARSTIESLQIRGGGGFVLEDLAPCILAIRSSNTP
jgi:hypothetical protein